MPPYKRLRALAFSLVLGSLASAASAVENYWTGGPSAWGDPASWTLGAPVDGQNLLIGYSPYAFSGGTTYASGTTSAARLFSKNALTISGGVLSLTALSHPSVGDSSIDSTLTATGGVLRVAGRLNVAGTTTLAGGTFAGSGTLALNGGLSIAGVYNYLQDAVAVVNTSTAVWSDGYVVADAGARFTNAAGAQFVANAGTTWSGGSFANAGTFLHASEGATQFAQVGFANTGSIEASAGTLRFSGLTSWSNSGTVKASGTGTIVFAGGTYDVAGLKVATSEGGRVTLSQANLQGSVWTLPETIAQDSVRLTMTTVKGVSIPNSDRLGFLGPNTLDGVSGGKGFAFTNGGTQTILNGFAPGGTVTMNFDAKMRFLTSRTIDFDVKVLDNALVPGSGVTAAPGSTVTLGAGATWSGTGGTIATPNQTAFDFRNEGAMSATQALRIDVAGGTLTNVGTIVGFGRGISTTPGPGFDFSGASTLGVGSGSFVNSGTIRGDWGDVNVVGSSGARFTNVGVMEAVRGGSLGVFKNAEAADVLWTNAGLLRADGAGSRLYLGGTFTQAGLGNYAIANGASAVVFAGTLDNRGDLLNVATRNAWALSTGGRILGGQIVGSTNLGFEAGTTPSILENVGLDGGLNVAKGGQVVLKGTTHLNGRTTIAGDARLSFSDDATIDHDIEASREKATSKIGMTKEGGTITVAAGAKVEGAFNINGLYPIVVDASLVNDGVLRGTGDGVFVRANVTNRGLYEQTAGRQTVLSGAFANAGALAATGGATIAFQSATGGLALTNSGTTTLGEGSAMTLGGTFVQTSTGRLGIGIGPGKTGLLAVTGDVALAGGVGALLADGFVPTVGSDYAFLTYTGTLTGSLSSLDSRWSVVYGNGLVALRANPVPEPATLAALGLGAVGLLRRRRRA